MRSPPISFLVRACFEEKFGRRRSARVALAPGRVNLIGEHTDYNEGFVFPMAVDRHVAVAFGRNGLRAVRAHSVDFDDEFEICLDAIEPGGGSGWQDYLAGVLWAILGEGHDLAGIDLVIAGDLPHGAGLSSSAALELAVARAAADASSIEWDAVAMAKIAQRAENDYVGVACGIMDQLAVACARRDHALLLDCRSLARTFVRIPEGAVVVVMDTGTRRSLATGAYNQRRRSCEDAVRALHRKESSARSLRDASIEQLRSSRAFLDATTYRRARHVIEENQRTLDMAKMLEAGRLEEAGRLMNQSHFSLRDLYEVSSPELNLITQLARRHRACFGARLTGAGFGGCAVALVRQAEVAAFTKSVESAYRRRTGLPAALYVCRPVEGARVE